MKYLEITGIPISEEISNGCLYPAASLAQKIIDPSSIVELRLFKENDCLRCLLGMENELVQGAVSELMRLGYSVEQVNTEFGKVCAKYVLTRELTSRAELIPNSAPKFIYDVACIEGNSFKFNSFYEFLNKCNDGSGFSILFGSAKVMDFVLLNQLTNANSMPDSVIEHMLSAPNLFPAILCSFSDNSKHAELIAKSLCYVFGGLTYKEIPPQTIDASLLQITNDNPKVRLISKLHTLFTAEEINVLADLSGTRCDYGLKYNKDSIVTRDTNEGMPKAEVKIGKDAQGQWIGIPFKTVSRHMFIGGAPRSGKGNLLTSLAFQFSEANVPFLMIESAKSELHHLRKVIPSLNVWRPNNGEYVLNPFSLPDDVTLDEYRASLNNIMRLSFNLEGTLVELTRDALRNCFSRNGFSDSSKSGDKNVTQFGINEILMEYRRLLELNGYSVNTKADMETCGLNRLLSLLTENPSVFDSIRSIPLNQLINGYNLLQLSSLSTLESKQLFATILLIALSSWLKLRMQNKSNKDLQLVVMIDESHNLLKSVTNSNGVEFSFAQDFEALLLEMSSLGVGFIIADQSSSNLPKGMADICATKIFLGGNRYSGIESFAEMMGLDDATMRNLYRLTSGEGLFYSDGMPTARVFKAPNVISKLNVNEDYCINNDFINNNPRFVIETFQECANCPWKEKCTIDIKTDARQISDVMFLECKPLLKNVEREKSPEERKKLIEQIASSLEKTTRKCANNDALLCCSVIQFLRLSNRWYEVPMTVEGIIKAISKRRI